jgi:hypothetical protein
MIRNDNTYALHLTKKGGEQFVDTQGNPISAVPVQVDFQPAREDAWFEAVRSGKLDSATPTDAVVRPLWPDGGGNDGRGLVSGFGVELIDGEGHCLAASTYDITYLTADARRMSAVFVRDGQLKGGETFVFKVFAFPAGQKPQPAKGIKIKVKSLASDALSIRTDRTLDDYLQGAEAYEDAAEQDYPVMVRRDVLDRIGREVRDSGAMETGGSLVMELRRCPQTQRFFSIISAHVPSLEQGELTRLGFKAETWDVARRAIGLRSAGERLGGWYHSHNYLMESCKTCEKRNEGACNASADFMSEQDVFLQRTIFPQAFTVALVASQSPCTGLLFALFGWSKGAVVRRGFYILDSLPDGARNDRSLETAAAAGEVI